MRVNSSKKQYVLAMVVVLLAMFPASALASPQGALNHASLLDVSNQMIAGTVTVESVFSYGPGYVVIYAEYQGGPGVPIGHMSIGSDWSYNVEIPITMSHATATLYAVLHSDTGQVGVYEFGMAWGADAPEMVDGEPIAVAFKVYDRNVSF